FLAMIPPPPSSTLFPYTTLFRSTLSNCPNPAGPVVPDNGKGVDCHSSDIDVNDTATSMSSHIFLDAKTYLDFHRDLNYAIQSGKDRKSTRLNSSHVAISYAVFCL